MPERVIVPHQDDMDDATFLKHMALRHDSELNVQFEESETDAHPLWVSQWIGSVRAFHKRLHQLEVANQYDHEHEEKL